MVEAASISRTQMRELLGVTKNMVTGILESRKYKDCLESVQVGDTKRVTKTSFIRFLYMQDKYRLIEDPPPGGILPTCLSLEEAAKAAGISRQSISTCYSNNCLIKNYINSLIGDTKLSDINTRFLETFYRRLQKTKAVP